MRNRKGALLLAAVIALQLCTIAGMIALNGVTADIAYKKGTQCKFEITHMWYNNSNGELHTYTEYGIDYFAAEYEEAQYLRVEESTDSFSVLRPCVDKPKGSAYVDIDMLYNENDPSDLNLGIIDGLQWCSFSKKSDDDYWLTDEDRTFESAWMEAYAYNGKLYAKNVYVDGVAITEYLENYAKEHPAGASYK